TGLEETRDRLEAEQTETYVVQPGDTLAGIALQVYGDASQWPRIMERNELADPNRIRPGMELVIPQ
ncbi:MAG: LysM peptidoglycan-binding domain-containing protein, partial [Candidatus Competibacterales bacterium]|nr:LysM peptidoglycan-binding domain-containing protein [Candidatus Competibacterales bacterium]